ncbi:MAG TPA: discoidin domain-containing protein, partial [Thermoanaerobaculia bacterium]|nr:discoidin domain-containing protein [Thermoanaerobaculia bacterium]
MRRLAPAALAGATLLLAAAATDPARRVLDDFDDVARWTAAPSDGVRLALSSEAGESGNALRMDFDFAGHAGWAAVRRKLSLDLPANYEFTFRIRGEAMVNNLEFKLVDESGENVWWTNRRDFEFPRDWRKIAVKKRHLGFAWGPAGGGELRRAASLEITVTAGTGGKGSVWLDELTFEELPPARPYTRQPEALASSDRPEHHWSLAVDGDGATSWQSETADAGEWMAIDFIERREYGGLSIDWEDNSFADAYAVEISDDAREWTTVREVVDGNGGRDYIFLPESESRYVRVRATRSGKGRFLGVREIAAEALEVGASENAFFERIAKDAPRASFPRSFSGEQSYWTVVGVDGDSEEALFSEDGALEPGKSSFSIEPFLRMDGALVGWDGVSTLQSLAEGDLPVPTVTRSRRGVTLETTAFAAGEPGRSTLYARYRIRNTGRARKSLDLFLAIRPFQVNPPSQFLNSPGGVARVRSIDRKGGSITVDGRSLVASPAPSRFGAVTFDGGDVTEYLRRGDVPPSESVTDPFRHASAALAWTLDLAPGAERRIDVAVPFHPGASPPADSASLDRVLADTLREWRGKLDLVAITVPPAARDLVRTMKSNLAYILINRDGPAIQPGSRAYERSWIRDGSLTSAALLRLGHAGAVREFVEWFTPYQFEDGKVPCCVDARGADPVPENDSHGELLYLLAEYGRFTKDRELLRKLWPNVEKTVAYIDRLRHQRMTDEYRSGDKLAFFGLLPESISHEGYSAKPVHSFWDDFFGIRGLKDAAEIAALLGRSPEEARFRAIAADFEKDVLASIARTIASRSIAYVPGSVELADFDATSTTIAIEPAGELDRLPRRERLATFERYYGEFRRRRSENDWDAYTPYEIRTVGTFVRLGWV